MKEPSDSAGSPVAEAYEFPSLTILKQTHMELLREEFPAESKETKPQFLSRVTTFMRRASATGRILDDDVERGIAQTLLNYWVTVLYRNGVPEDSIPQSFLMELDETAGRDLDDSQCPYRGFAAYSESSAHLFFGRKHVTDDWIAALAKRPVLVVLGASGSGKTSLIRAGLLPALKANAVSGSADWEVTEIILSKENSREDLLSGMKNVAHRTRALLVIHRLDELFLGSNRAIRRELMDAVYKWVTKPETDRHIVVSARLKSASVLTNALRESKLATVGTTVFIPPFEARELRAVIVKPAEQIGLRFDEGLVDTLINDFLGDPAALALLQFMLLKLWDARERNHITWAAYEGCGGGLRVVEQTAESVYHAEDFEQHDRDLIKELFLQLVRPSFTTELIAERVPMSTLASTAEDRRRVEKIIGRFEQTRLLREIREASGGPCVEVAHEALMRKWPRMLEWLEDSRLELIQKQRVSMAAAQWREQGRDRSALWSGVLLAAALSIRDQLKAEELEFVNASVRAADRRRLRNRIVTATVILALCLLAVMLFHSGRKTEAALDLERAERLVEAGDPAGAFLYFQHAASVDWERLWNAENREMHRRRLGTARRQLPRLENMRNLPELIQSQLSPDGKFLIGRSARKEGSKSEVVIWNLDDSSSEKIEPLKDHKDHEAKWAAFHPGRLETPLVAIAVKAVEGKNGKVLVEELVADNPNAIAWEIEFERDVPEKAWFCPADDEHLLVLAKSEVSVWEFRNAKRIASARAPIENTGLSANWAAFSEDGELVAIAVGDRSGGLNGKVWIWDWKSDRNAEHAVELPHGGPVVHVEFDRSKSSADSGEWHLVTATASEANDNGAARVWSIRRRDGKGGLEPSAVTGPLSHRGTVRRARFSPDGKWVASGGSDGVARLWHVGTQKEVLILKHDGDVYDLSFSPDGRQLATASRDRMARIWETATGELVTPPLNHSETVIEVAFSRDGRSLLTTSKHIARIWMPEQREPRIRAPGQNEENGPILEAEPSPLSAVSSDGQFLLTVGAKSRAIKLWKWERISETGDWVIASQGSSDMPHVLGAFLDQDCSHVALAGHDSNKKPILQIFRRSEGNLSAAHRLGSELLGDGEVVSAAFAPAGKTRNRLAVILRSEAGTKSEVVIFDLAENSPEKKVLHNPRENSEFKDLHYSPHGRFLLATIENDRQGPEVRALRWDLNNLSKKPLKLQHDSEITTVDFSSQDEKWLLTGSSDDDAKIWDLHNEGTVLKIDKEHNHTHTADLTRVLFSPVERKVLTAAKDQTAILWTVDEQGDATKIAVLRHSASVTDVAFSHDGKFIVTASAEPRLRVWSAATGELITAFTPKGGILQAGFASKNSKGDTAKEPGQLEVFAIGQTRVTRVRPSTEDTMKPGLREVRRMTWNFDPWNEKLENMLILGNLIAARQLESGQRHKRKALEKVPTNLLLDRWGYVIKASPELLGLSERGRISYHKAEAKQCEISNQHFAAAWHLTQLLNISAGEKERAALLIRRARAIQNEPNWRYGLTTALGDLEEAKNLGRIGVEDYERIATVHFELGQGKKRDAAIKQWDLAIEALKKTAELDPENPERQISLGEAYAGKRDFKMAREAFAKAGELTKAKEPGKDIAPARLAFISLLSGDLNSYQKECRRIEDETLDGWESYALLWPSVLPPVSTSGPPYIFENAETFMNAIGIFLSPTVSRLDLASESTNMPNYIFDSDKAFTSELVGRAEKWCNESPSNYYRRNTYGAALYRAGRYEEAIRELETSRALHIAETTSKLSNAYDHLIRVPTSPTPDGRPVDWVFLAMANAKLGRRTEAWDWMRKLLVMPEFKDRQGVPMSNMALPVPYDSLALELLFDEAYALLRSTSNHPSRKLDGRLSAVSGG